MSFSKRRGNIQCPQCCHVANLSFRGTRFLERNVCTKMLFKGLCSLDVRLLERLWCTKQSSGWRCKNQLMNVASLQKFWNMRRIFSLTLWWLSSMIWWWLDRYQLIGEKHPSKCCRKPCVPRFHQNTARLQPYDCFTNFLLTCFWDGWKPNWKPISQKNNMAFGAADVLKNIWWLHIWYWINFPTQTCQFGLSAWTCQKPSTEYIGQHYGALFPNKAFQNTWFGWSKSYIETSRGKLLAAMVAADPLPYTVVYDKDAF